MFQIKDAKIIISNNNADQELGFQKKKRPGASRSAAPRIEPHVSPFLLQTPLQMPPLSPGCTWFVQAPIQLPFSSPHAFPEASATHNTRSAPKTLDLPARPRYLTSSVQSPSTAEPGSQLSFQVWRSFSQAQSLPSGWTTPSISTIRAPQS